ncbi:MAG: hypothetical protein AB8H79_15545 [Myxococcota bacterium]
MRERLEAAVSWAPEARQAIEGGWAGAASAGLVGLGRFWCLGLAAFQGWSFVEAQGDTLIVERAGRYAAILPVPVPAPRPAAGQLDALRKRLNGLFVGRAWALVVRRPLPGDLDLERILEPVRMWLVALDRGRWEGDYAIYEDGGLSVELRVLDEELGAKPGLVLCVPTVAGDLTTEDVAERLAAVMDSSALSADIPKTLALIRGDRWRLNTARRLELLYGKVHEYVAGNTGTRTITFHQKRHHAAPGRALFTQAPFRGVSSVWWLGSDPADPLMPRGVADENPWGNHPGEGPVFPGPRLAVTATGPDSPHPASLSELPGSPVRK